MNENAFKKADLALEHPECTDTAKEIFQFYSQKASCTILMPVEGQMDSSFFGSMVGWMNHGGWDKNGGW